MSTQWDLRTFESRVSAEMAVRFGLSWADACGDREPLEMAMSDGQSPEEFVSWFAEKYGLAPVQTTW